MFNSPILDVSIGLIFLFLIYSLLATSISEGVATLFALRARMLRKGIIKGMLSNAAAGDITEHKKIMDETAIITAQPKEDHKRNTWGSIVKALQNFVSSFMRVITGMPYPYKKGTPGGDFYLHPIIKNFGASRRYSVPSYIPSSTFYTVFTNVLEQYFIRDIKEISKANSLTEEEAFKLPKVTKINYLIDYLAAQENNSKTVDIDADTLEILHVYLKESYHNPDVFRVKMEDWFNTTMDRVSGWYKRQMQYVLFVLGLVLAIAFNVDVIEIAGKLSTDKDARDKLVAIAIKAEEQYKDDPRVIYQKNAMLKGEPGAVQNAQVELKEIHSEYSKQADSIKALLNGDIKDTNNLLALGWDKKDAAKCFNFSNIFKGTRPIGYLLFAFGICLGAPFWFDMLQKIIKLRASGKKENGNDGNATKPQPIQVNVHNNTTSGEAIG